ncbi:hypothetical protein Dimus_039627 [Dionaea muscipula]
MLTTNIKCKPFDQLLNLSKEPPTTLKHLLNPSKHMLESSPMPLESNHKGMGSEKTKQAFCSNFGPPPGRPPPPAGSPPTGPPWPLHRKTALFSLHKNFDNSTKT